LDRDRDGDVGAGEVGVVGSFAVASEMVRLVGRVRESALGCSGCFDKMLTFASVMLRFVEGFGEAGLAVDNCFNGDSTEGSGTGMGFDLTVRGGRFGRDGAARSSTLLSSFGGARMRLAGEAGLPGVANVSRGSEKDTRDVFIWEPGVIGFGGGCIDI